MQFPPPTGGGVGGGVEWRWVGWYCRICRDKYVKCDVEK
jgi:hypothetical protein